MVSNASIVGTTYNLVRIVLQDPSQVIQYCHPYPKRPGREPGIVCDLAMSGEGALRLLIYIKARFSKMGHRTKGCSNSEGGCRNAEK